MNIFIFKDLFESMQNAFQVHHPKFPFPKKELDDAPANFHKAFLSFGEEVMEAAKKNHAEGYDQGKRHGFDSGYEQARSDQWPGWLLVAIGFIVGIGLMLVAEVSVAKHTELSILADECLEEGGQFMASAETSGRDIVTLCLTE